MILFLRKKILKVIIHLTKDIQLQRLKKDSIKSLGNIELPLNINFENKLYTFGKHQKLNKLMKYPLLKKRELVNTLGEITWIINYYYPEVKYCPTLFYLIMLLVNFYSKQKTFYIIKTMIQISKVIINFFFK